VKVPAVLIGPMVAPRGLLTDTEPLQLPIALHEVAPEVVHTAALVWPCLIDAGRISKFTDGTNALPLAACPEPGVTTTSPPESVATAAGPPFA
jgi:hypothetical protein